MRITYVTNPGGPKLGLTTAKLIQQDGLYFKDLEGTGELLPYEDWRLSPEERAQDLAQRLSRTDDVQQSSNGSLFRRQPLSGYL